MAFEENPSGGNTEALFDEIMGDVGFDMATGLLLDISGNLHRLAAARKKRPESWFDYHRTWHDSDRLEVVIVERHDPANREQYSRVLTRQDTPHPAGMLVQVADQFISPLSGCFLRDVGTYLIRKSAQNWPLGSTGRPIIYRKNDEVELLSGNKYEHFPPLPVIESHTAVLDQLQQLNLVLGGLSEATSESSVRPSANDPNF